MNAKRKCGDASGFDEAAPLRDRDRAGALMRLALRLAALMAVAAGLWETALAQDLSPRAYIITPIHSNAVTLTYGFYRGGVDFDGAAPITNATGTYSVPVVTYYHSINFFGRSANFNASLPYAVGNFQGTVGNQQQQQSIYRSGLTDSTYRLSVNLLGGPAMPAREYAKWKQKVLLGASLKILAPTGQYDPLKLVNWGANRWAVKPELGYSERWGHWVVDAYGGVWFYTKNPQYYSIPRPLPQTEAPIGSFEGHLSYDIKTKLWFSLDGNYWWGGVTSLSGIANPATRQTSSRVGVTASLPFRNHQSFKISYNDGAYIRFGGNYQNVSVAWQYSWVGKRW